MNAKMNASASWDSVKDILLRVISSIRVTFDGLAQSAGSAKPASASEVSMLLGIPIGGFRKAMHPMGLLPVLLLALSCGPARVVVMPEYAEQKGDGKTLVVAPFEAIILNRGDVTDDLGPGDPEKVYLSWARRSLAAGLKKNSSFSDIVVDSSVVAQPHPSLEKMKELIGRHGFKRDGFTGLLDPALYDEGSAPIGAPGGKTANLPIRTLPLEKSSIEIPLPPDGVRVEYASTMADLVLFLDELTVSRDPGKIGDIRWVPGPPGTPGNYSYSGGSSTALIQEVNFAIWDNKIGKLIAYGKASSRTTVIVAMRRNTWKQGLEALAKSILNQTPYYQRAHSSDGGYHSADRGTGLRWGKLVRARDLSGGLLTVHQTKSHKIRRVAIPKELQEEGMRSGRTRDPQRLVRDILRSPRRTVSQRTSTRVCLRNSTRSRSHIRRCRGADLVHCPGPSGVAGSDWG
jgi:hypothetical protein